MKERKEKLKEEARKGDLKAKLRLAKPFSYEYWEAYQAIETHEKDEETARFKRYVNGISVYDDDFIEKVLFTIEEKGVIFSELIEIKRDADKFKLPEN